MSEERTPPEAIYSNIFQVTTGPYDVVLDFGFRTPEHEGEDYDQVARITMSMAHLKTMVPLLAKVVASYEDRFGEVPAPGFDQFGKE